MELLSSAGGRDLAEATRRLKRLEPRIASARQSETDEMLSKLKDLGNNILGKDKMIFFWKEMCQCIDY